MRNLAKNLVVVGSLIALGAFGAWVVLRPRLPRGEGFTDGEQFLAATRTREELRLARWEAPERLSELADGGSTSDPFVDPASGRIYFVRGEAGAEDLWVATPEGDGRVVRPLSELNTAARETAPAFCDGWLWFASDRPGGRGGLDLWRAPLSGERFLAPENLGDGLNTPADETDPAPRDRAGTELWFASNRENVGTGDFDLVFARGDGVRWSLPQLAQSVQSPFDERAPAFTPDGRLLLFASDRPGGAGGFDLWRALLKDGEFQPPVNLGAPNGPGHESGPAPADDGFTLLYGRDSDATGRFDLLRTRTRELFPVEAPRFTLADFTILLLLALVALLAWLARRWEALDVLYKCMVVSLLVHLLFLWWTRRVDVEAEVRALAAGGERSWEVRLLADLLSEVAKLEDRARGEQVDASAHIEIASEPRRAEAVAVLPELSSPAPGAEARVARGESAAPADAPAADARPVDRGATAPLSADPVRDPGESFERLGGGLAALPVAARESAAPGRVAAADVRFAPSPGGRSETRLSAREASGARAERAATDGSADAAPLADAGRARLPGARARAEREQQAVAVAVPNDRADRAGDADGDAAPAALPLAPSAAAANASGDLSGAAAPRRAGLASGVSFSEEAAPRSESPLAGAGRAEPAPPATATGARAASGPASPPARPAPIALAPLPAEALGAREVETPASTFRLEPSSSPHDRPREVAATTVAAPVRASLLPVGRAPELGPSLAASPIELPPAPAAAPPPSIAAAAPADLSRLYERRFGEQKSVALREGGGSEETERAVLAGLRYLARIQRPKGYYGPANEVDPGGKYRDFRVGKTGLCVLAFLGAGHTHRSQSEFSPNVTRALAWLVAQQDPRSGHFGNSESYSHGIAAYALAECYAMTKDAELRAPLERALGHLLEVQTHSTGDPRKDGGWTYYYREGPGFDAWPRASISAWQVMALESAKVGGIDVPEEALASARVWFLKSFDPGFGGFRYTHNPSWLNNGYGTLPASTPASMFALTLLGEKDHARVAAAEEYVLDRLPAGFRSRGEDAFVRRGQGNIYFWYYSTLALFCRGGAPWRTWNEALKLTLLPAQQRDGSWEPIDLYSQRYAHDSRDDRSYSTAMCVLMLEVYYRYFTPLLGKFDPP